MRQGGKVTAWLTPSGCDGQRLRHMPVQTPPEAGAGARPLVPQPAGPHDRLLLLQERGECSAFAPTRVTLDLGCFNCAA